MASSLCCAPISAQDLPPLGRSLFDHLTVDARGVQRVPFPFTALMGRVQREVGADALGHAGVRSVLIPLGRSLQRNASVYEAYRYPRIVAAVVGEPVAGAPLLKDRLYFGYHEKTGLLEVISYNEAAGRFEFQVVKDYRPGGVARAFYARRVVCMSCHHGAAPIFSRPGWDETNANPRVAAQLERAGRSFHGVPAARSIDEPNAIDNAVARSSRLELAQRVWREGCAAEDAVDCRAQALLAALKYRLGADRAVDVTPKAYRDKLLAPLRAARARWPDGLPVVDPGIPNRDPLAAFPVDRREFGDAPALLRASELRPAFDPLQPRAPAAHWHGGNEADVASYIRSVAEFVASADIRAIDLRLRKLRGDATRRSQRASCRPARSSPGATLQCASAPSAEPSLRAEIHPLGRAGARSATASVSAVSVGGATLLGSIELAPADHRASRARITTWSYHGSPLRLSDATAIERVTLRWVATDRSSAEVEFSLADDTPRLVKAIDELARRTRAGESDALADAPIRRGALMRGLFAQLGAAPPPGCCEPPLRAVQPGLDDVARRSREALPAPLQSFVRHCAACHDTREDAPPGFLHGGTDDMRRGLERCADRIAYRLAMWERAPDARARVPMPPPLANGVAVAPPPAEEIAQMRAYVEQLAGPGVHAEVPYEARPACRDVER